jgi:phosphopantothenoylcysteine decarboxylase/phosphopantothenate--cysteine ligase
LNSPTKGNRPPYTAARSPQDITNRKILLGVCGGIAAYKAVELTRLLIKAGARVQVVMTEAAQKFVTPLTFETITGRHVFVEMFPDHGEFSPWHTEMASWPDIAVIAPATANHMARLAAGIADDLLSTIMLTLDRPRLLCPSMNHRMWANPATQDNLGVLKRRGFRFVMPTEGDMARPGEDAGIGRLAEPDMIVRELTHVLSAPQDLRGVRVLVTAGRTEESWDPVRVLTNRASGRMGFALAEEARERGADVVLIHGPTDVIPPVGVRVKRVTTAAEMAQAVKQDFPQSRIILMAAAVADYTFARTAEHKIKKGEPEPELHLVATEDILKNLADRKGDRIVVGFALETENLLENALRKLREKHLDIVVANNPLLPGSGFAGETNQVLMIHRNGRVNDLPLQSKREAARDILNAVIEIFRNPEPEPETETRVADDTATLDALPDIEDDFELPIPAAASATAAATTPTPSAPAPAGAPLQPGQSPHPSRSSRRNKRRKSRHGQGQAIPGQGVPSEGQAPIISAESTPHPEAIAVSTPVEPKPVPVEAKPIPAESKPAVVEPKPAPSGIKPVLVVPKSAMIESKPSPAPRSVRVTSRPAPVKPQPVKAEPVAAPVESKTPAEVADAAAELPFPGTGAVPAAKKGGKTRRGGRRSARARAARHGGEPGAPPSGETAPHVESAAPAPVVVDAPVKVPTPAPVAEKTPAGAEGEAGAAKPARKPRAAGTYRKKPAVKKAAKPAKEKPSSEE